MARYDETLAVGVKGDSLRPFCHRNRSLITIIPRINDPHLTCGVSGDYQPAAVWGKGQFHEARALGVGERNITQWHASELKVAAGIDDVKGGRVVVGNDHLAPVGRYRQAFKAAAITGLDSRVD